MRRWLVKGRGGSSWEASIVKVATDFVDVGVGDETLRLGITRVGNTIAFVMPSGRIVTPIVGPSEGNGYEVLMNGRTLYLSEAVNGVAASRVTGIQQSRIRSQMPGRVVKVLVSPGDEVEDGQGVAILEAMKMENEVKASRAGIIGRLFVSEGDLVDAGADLLEFE